MFEFYQETIKQRGKLPLNDERKLVILAKRGKYSAQEEILLHLTGFFIYRIRTTLHPSIVRQHGEDILQDCLVLAIKSTHTYKLRYRNKKGELQPVHLSTYMWKGTTGVMFSYVKSRKEICFSDFSTSRIKLKRKRIYIELNER